MDLIEEDYFNIQSSVALSQNSDMYWEAYLAYKIIIHNDIVIARKSKVFPLLSFGHIPVCMNSSSENLIFKCKSCALYIKIRQWNYSMLKFLQENFLNESLRDRVYDVFFVS